MTIARSQCVHTPILHVNHNIQVYALRMQCMQYVHKYYDASYAAKHIHSHCIHSHCIYMCEECMYWILCNLYSNTAPSVCIDFMYAIYALCASYAAALYASKYLYVRLSICMKVWSIQGHYKFVALHCKYVQCIYCCKHAHAHISYARATYMFVSGHESWLWGPSGRQGPLLVAFDHRTGLIHQVAIGFGFNLTVCFCIFILSGGECWSNWPLNPLCNVG